MRYDNALNSPWVSCVIIATGGRACRMPPPRCRGI